ncbi:uncharacterized protein [Dermacentor andersoni]|uniref:uncharacterized protein n=1 Tax=Dermacentor andersoni TaxID=34620 RepID=UPI002417F27F|nr:ensconsin-like [Dermacentor andersoni]
MVLVRNKTCLQGNPPSELAAADGQREAGELVSCFKRMEAATVEAGSSPVSTAFGAPHSTASLAGANDDADVPTEEFDSIGLSEDERGDSASRPTLDCEDGDDDCGGERRTADQGTDSVGTTTAPSSVSSTDDAHEEAPSAWTLWYLRKDLEWRQRARHEHESRRVALSEARAAAELEASQRSRAERAFAAWCATKREQEAARRAEERRRLADAEAQRKRTEQRTCALSERKCREWLARKQVEQEASFAKKQRTPTSGSAEKAAANQSAFDAWLTSKSTMPPTEKFHVKCIDGQLFALWR